MNDIIIIGSGPVGLAAAVHAKQHDLQSLVLEKKRLLESLHNFPTYMRFFTTANKLEIGGIPFPSVLDKPSKTQAIEYYQGIVRSQDLRVKQWHHVQEILGEEGSFTVTGVNTRNQHEEPFAYKAKYVIVATGYYDNPNGLGGIPGETLPHVKTYYDDPHLYYDHDVVIIGAGNSGAEAALELYRIGANVTILHDKPTLPQTIKYWVKPDLENRIKEGNIKAFMPAKIMEITNDMIAFHWHDTVRRVHADTIFVLTGFTPNTTQLRAWGIQTHQSDQRVKLTTTFETTRHGVFVIGSAGFGKKTNAVFIENGREHARQAVNEIIHRITDPTYIPKRTPLTNQPKTTNQ